MRGKDRGLRAAQQHFPELSARLQAVHSGSTRSVTGSALQAAHTLLPASVRSSTPSLAELSSLDDKEARKAGKDLKTAVAEHLACSASVSLSHKRKLILAGSAQPGAAAFLTVAPSSKRLRMTPAQFVAAVNIRLGLPHPQLRGLPGSGDCLGRGIVRAKGKARIPHDVHKHALADFSKEAGYIVDVEPSGLFGQYPNQAQNATKKGEKRKPDMSVHDNATGESVMTDNFITDGAGSGGSLSDPFALLKQAEKKKIKKYVDGTAAPGYKFIPLGFGVQGEMMETSSKWLSDTALAVAKRQSDDVYAINKLK